MAEKTKARKVLARSELHSRDLAERFDAQSPVVDVDLAMAAAIRFLSDADEERSWCKGLPRGKAKAPFPTVAKESMKEKETVKFKDPATQNIWKSKALEKTEKGAGHGMESKASSSGLSIKEKQATPIDLVDQSPSNPSSEKWRITKEKHATIMKNSKEEGKPDSWDTPDQNKKLTESENNHQQRVVCKQLAVFVPQIDLKSRFAVLDDLNDDNSEAIREMNNINIKETDKEGQVDGVVVSEEESDSDVEADNTGIDLRLIVDGE
ncbi:OLC1v1000573C1 [Oldenlandia corymbosa var. corymbosa]|uniref:OLC1v1000573C1 n=1 Tax=Oldenlandia corymbosa var. corymbosa TaxID=529605 RepID=A0AAV1D398_OLDCO|nr:OLC1v1000573C1 [Oldenlandia corymbosa var. corymbosa]